jgi:hypothetical protein
MVPYCKHYAWRGIHDPSVPAHFCHATNGECKPIQAGPDVSECPSFIAEVRHNDDTAELEGDCIHLGDDTSELVTCTECAGTQLKVFACAVHGRCTLARPGDGVPATCEGCADRKLSDKPLMQVRSVSAGIGDNLMTLAIGEGLRQQFGSELAIVSPPKHHPWLRLFDGLHIAAKPLPGPECFCEHDVGTKSFEAFRAQKIGRWDYWARQFGVKPALPKLKPLPRGSVNRAVPMSARVALVPFAAYPERTWPLDNWLELEWQLYQRGFRTLILSDTAKNTEQFKGDKAIGESPANVAALLNVAVCVVGNDSGMAHLAGLMRRPTVALCFPASDRNIFGYAPTVTMLGDGGKPVMPSTACRAVLDKVRAGLGDFPVERFDSIILEQDRWRIDCWRDVYAVLWRTVRHINPRRIVEIGTRAGYSAWTMLDACPEASLIGIDANFDGDLAVTHGGFYNAVKHAQRILAGRDFTLRIADSQQLDTLPAADLAYVDGDHTGPGCLHDMESVARSDIPAMLVDDTQFSQVREAITTFAARGGWSLKWIPSDTGLALLQRL